MQFEHSATDHGREGGLGIVQGNRMGERRNSHPLMRLRDVPRGRGGPRPLGLGTLPVRPSPQ